MFTISVQKLKIEAIIGILPKERLLPQLIEIDSFIEYNKSKESFLDYVKVVNIIESMLIENKYRLIEDALEDITLSIKREFKEINSIKMRISKPDILKNCVVGVEFFRKS